ncbi:uncharacterized protein LOC116189593 [Punica granatum]|uniref:DUF1677 family protein n=2 Tax=Punica granatum TaxID=22663 RepID=A0A218WX09_PUNGR|nr:uncharacterized protein LOC116189593 [Punica granatum]OWM77327.1 hypothetical protein CDL15_Pgr028964 [Punica granatum]PKI43499.1 hypothetical protein CRG98_036101 [Punica granatum]
MAISSETPSQSGKSSSSSSSTSPLPPLLEVETAKCDSCGFTEDCTVAYILRIRERFHGRWICGLCIEAVKDEILRSERRISTEEALNRHINFCRKFRSPKPVGETEHPISAIGRLLRRSLDSPRPLRTSSSYVLRGIEAVDSVDPKALVRSGSCFSSISS